MINNFLNFTKFISLTIFSEPYVFDQKTLKSFNSNLKKNSSNSSGTKNCWYWNWKTVPSQFQLGTGTEKQFQVPTNAGTGTEKPFQFQVQVGTGTEKQFHVPTHTRTPKSSDRSGRNDPLCSRMRQRIREIDSEFANEIVNSRMRQ